MMSSKGALWTAPVLLALAAVGCGGDGNGGEVDCQAGEMRCEGDVLMECDAGVWVQSQDCAAGGGSCVEEGQAAAHCESADPWAVSIAVDGADGVDRIALADLQRTEIDGQEALELETLVAELELELPWNYHYSFVGNDGWDPLVEKMDGDPTGLPHRGELAHGYLAFEEGALRLFWDEAIGFPRYLSVQGMDGGTLRLIPFGAADVLVSAGDARSLVDVSGLATEEVTDYRHPEDGAMPMVPLPTLFDAAGIATIGDYGYSFCGQDGFCNGADNPMPAADVDFCYLEPGERRVVCEEGHDAEQGTWRVRDVVVILGL